MSTPQCAFLKIGCEVRESIVCRSSPRGDAGCTPLNTVTHAVSENGTAIAKRARTTRRLEKANTVVDYSLLKVALRLASSPTVTRTTFAGFGSFSSTRSKM